MKYDDAAWHYEGNFPTDLPDEAGATHIGMFVAWALLSGLAGRIHVDEYPENLPRLRARTVTPGLFLLEACDGKFSDEDLNDEGNAFAQYYFADAAGGYLADYDATLGQDWVSLYHVPDSWESYDQLAPIITERFAEWRKVRLRMGTA